MGENADDGVTVDVTGGVTVTVTGVGVGVGVGVVGMGRGVGVDRGFGVRVGGTYTFVELGTGVDPGLPALGAPEADPGISTVALMEASTGCSDVAAGGPAATFGEPEGVAREARSFRLPCWTCRPTASTCDAPVGELDGEAERSPVVGVAVLEDGPASTIICGGPGGFQALPNPR